jgi:predicted small lipoprotein YifL
MKRSLSKLLVAVALATLVACGYPGPPKPPSLNLPQPPSDLRAIRKGDHVYLSWTAPTETTDGLTIHRFAPTQICRSTIAGSINCTAPIAEVAAPTPPSGQVPAPKLQQSFTDPLPPTLLTDNPSSQIFYAVSVLNPRGRSAGLSNVVDVPGIVAPQPPADFHAEVTAAGVVLRWTPIAPANQYPNTRRVYRIYRREANADTIVGEAPLNASALTDQSFDWEKTYPYRATVVTFINVPGSTERQFESDDTPTVTVFAHDVFPPAVPTGLQAAFSGVGQQPFIDLIWTPDNEPDLAGYNIYRHEEAGEATKVNSAPVKTPSFRDTNVASGHTYIYSVSAVDIRGNESARSGEASESVP